MKIRTNLIYNICYQILIIILPLITAPYVSRVLGNYNIGVYSYTQAFANYFYLFAMLGVNNYGNRTIAMVRDDEKKMSITFWEIFSFQFGISIIIGIAYLLYCFLFIKEDEIIYLIQFFYVISAAFDVNWLCFGLERFKLTTIRSTIIRILMAAAVFVFVKDKSDIAIYTAILAIGNLCAVLTVWPFVIRQVSWHRPRWKGVVRHLKPNMILFLPVIAVSLYNIMDKLMLGSLGTKEEVGFYTYAERITQIPNTLILALDNVIMPRMSNLYSKKNSAVAQKLMDNVMLFAMFASAAMAFGLAGVAPVFTPWFYGKEYVRCGLFVVMLCPIIVFKGWAGALRTQFIIPTKRDNIYIFSLSSGAITNLILNYFLIPKLQGIGAVIGTIAAEFVVCFIQFFMTRKDIPIRKYLIDGCSFCCIGYVMYIVISCFNKEMNPIGVMGIQIVVGGLIYLCCSGVYMVKIRKNSILVDEVFRVLKIQRRR